MNLFFSCNNRLAEATRSIEPLGYLFLRLWLAQEFIMAGYLKLSGGFHAPEWFAGLEFPLPVSLLPADINWSLASGGEIALGLLILFGLWGRLAAAGLLFITFVAVYSVHFDLGLGGWNQIETEQGLGFKVPLMMALMLLVLLFNGMGRFSLDYLWHKKA